jgi:hypothetical protein
MRFSNCIPSRHICRLSGASDYIASNCPASVTRNACVGSRYCTRLASTAMQYRIEEKSTKASYIKKPELI